ncbi:MAG: tetratricopeptide repeat protein [Paracoccaceae bacterium]
MSGLQTLAEHGTGLCLLAVGVSNGAVAVSGAVLGAAALDTYLKCANRGAKRAAENALKAMAENAPDLQAADVSAAQNLIQTTPLNLDPQQLAAAIDRYDAPTVVLVTTFGDRYTKAEPGVQAALLAAVSAALQAIRQDDAFDRVFVQDMVIAVLREQGALRKEVQRGREENRDLHAQTQTMIAELMEKVDRHKLSESLVIALARKYAEGSPMDFEAAYAGLERALEVAAEARDRLPGNVSDAVTVVERRVRELNDAGEVDAAEDALWEELERAEAAQLRLVERGLEQVVLTRNVNRAVALEMKKWTLEDGGFQDLQVVQDVWYVRGRDKGLRFDLEVSIGLAEVCCGRATTNDERGTALNDKGVALWTLGQRESGTARLEQAVTAFRATLEEWTRDRVPLDWAGTQNNLGNALESLGERESGTARLEQAVTAYRAALQEQTQDRVPLDWATTQNNLGTALQSLGERTSSTARLEEAVTAYRAALEERTRDRVPLDWAGTQNNLGILELAFFDKTGDETRLDAADRYAALAREVFVEAGADHYVSMADDLIAAIAARRAG